MDKKDKESMDRAGPEGTDAPVPAAGKKVLPNEGVKQFKVRARGVASFRRAGITFGPDPTVVNAESLTAAQQVELVNTPTLSVEQIGGAPPKS